MNEPASPTLADIRDAAGLVAGNVLRTPFLPAPKLSELTEATVSVKYENLQVTNSFKERGAFVKLTSLDEGERARGVIAMSAGNHAQAVAYHARRLAIPATIVMPVTTPHVKVRATESHGAEVVLDGETLADSQLAAERIAAGRDLVWVHPYDDFDVIRGQGTIGLEMIQDDPDLDVIVVPVGGGGLISGIATAVKGLKPGVEIVGVETQAYPSLEGALSGRDVVCGGNTLAEGIAVKNVGRLPLAICRRLMDRLILVDEPQIERAVNAYLTLQKTMAEGAGAAGLAAMFAEPEHFRGRRVGLVLCGGNIDPRILASIMMRELAREEHIVAVRIAIPDRPGVLGEIATLLGDLAANILEVSHKRQILEIPAKGASVDITMEVRDGAHGERVMQALRQRGFGVTRLPAQ